MTQMEKTIPKWHLKMDYVETCNCDYGCPCNFNGFPTYGFCRGLLLNHIRSGNYGNINLDGLDVIYAESWPKAIHEGNGTMQLFITKKATNEQRDALVNIFSGEDQETEIHLPKGFIWKVAHAAKTKLMRISTAHLNFDESGKSAFVSVVEYKGP